MHLIDNLVEPADFVDEENLHSLRVFMPRLAIDIAGVALDQFGDTPRNIEFLIAQWDIA